MKKILALGFVVLALAGIAQAASYGTVWGTLGNALDKSEVVTASLNHGPAEGSWMGAWDMKFDTLQMNNPHSTASFLWGKYDVFCMDPWQDIDTRAQYSINDLKDGPVPIYSSYTGMGATKAGQVATLLANDNLDGAMTPGDLTKDNDTALAVAIWEIVMEPTDNTGSDWNLTSGEFKITSASTTMLALANAKLNALKLNSHFVDYSLISTSPFYALISTSRTGGQDLLTAIAIKRPPVPEPVTMISAFMAMSSLGLYIRKRIHA